jgi:hypothetical protein
MNSKVDELLPTAADCNKRMAVAEAEKASEYVRKQAAVDAEKTALLDKLKGPSGVSDDERLKRAAAIINRAVNNGLTEVEVGRFPNTLFTDRARRHRHLSKLGREIAPLWTERCYRSGILRNASQWPSRNT